MLAILYVILFAFTIVLEVSIAEKSKGNRLFWIIVYILLYILGVFAGGILGDIGGRIYKMKYSVYEAGVGFTLGGAMHGFVVIPFFVLLFINLYKSKKLNICFTIIYILESLGISLGGFFLLLIG